MKNKINKLKDTLPTIVLLFSLSFMLFIYAPIEVYFSDVDQFTYDIYDILKYMLPVFLCVFFCGVILFLLFKWISERLFRFCCAVSAIVFIATYIQGSYMSGFLPVIDGKPVVWEQYLIQRIYTILLWIVVTGCIIIICKKFGNKGIARLVKWIGCTGLLLMLMTLIINGFTVEKAFKDKYNIAMSSGSLLDMSEEQNFVILVLDGVDATAYEELKDKHPEYEDYFEDFTFFRNTMGAYPYTSRAVPQIISGIWYENDQGLYEYTSKSLSQSPLLNTLKEKKYNLTLYMTDYLNIEGVLDTFSNVTKAEKLVDPVKFCKMQIMFAGLRYLPFDLKPYCELTLDAIEADSMRACALGENYSMANDWFYKHICEMDITKTRQKQFHYIHINGAHNPFEYDENVNKVENATYESCIEAAMKIAGTYLNKLRESEVYDNTVLFVMADHGYGRGKEEPLDKQNPVLFVKGINEKHPYVISDAPVSYDDLQQGYQTLLNGGTALEAFPWKNEELRLRRYLSMVYYDTSLTEYYQSGWAADEETMQATGVVYPAV